MLVPLLAGHAVAQAPPRVVQPAPTYGPPVIVVPGVPTPPPASVTVTIDGVSAPVCPVGVPCPPPCPVGAACPPPPCLCAQLPAPPPTIVVSGAAPTTTTVVSEPVEVVPTTPAPGTFAVGYLGTFDGTDVLHGGALRFTGHLADVAFLELVLGGQGARTATRDIGEFVALLGPRIAAPLIVPNLRIYGVLDTGILVRSIGNGNTWGIFPVQLGGGLEVGGELGENWSIGGYVDARVELRVPFERDPVSVGVVWSAGLALLWF